jgi:hypothetical protein
MAKIQTYEWKCDAPGCSKVHSTSDPSARYIDVPPGWAEISVTELNEEDKETPDCTCACHEDEEDDEGNNLAGHETYDCEVCPEDREWVMSATLCEMHYKKFTLDYQLPRLEEPE